MSELVVDLVADEARELTRKIRVGLEGTYSLIIEAFRRRAWVSLGYAHWDAYCQGEFGNLSLQPPREEREQVILSLREAGLSVRAISSATRLGVGTIARELGRTSGVPNGTPGSDRSYQGHESRVQIIGLDGKSYTPSKPVVDTGVQPYDVPLPLGDDLLDMDAADLGIGVKTERPKVQVSTKPPMVTVKDHMLVPWPERTPKAQVIQGELFDADQLVKASRSLVVTSSLIAETDLDFASLGEEVKVMITAELQDVVDRLNVALDRLAS